MKLQTLPVFVAAFFGAVSSANSDPTPAKVLSPTRIYQVIKSFTDDQGGVALNISGLACMSADAARSTCLVIDDQGRFAQVATIGKETVTAGARLPLVGRKPSKDTIGRPPAQVGCSGGIHKFKDLDGEAVAYASPFFYVVGSHGCSRNSNKFRSSAFILARISESALANSSVDLSSSVSVETSYRFRRR
jgi:hypothetical protein